MEKTLIIIDDEEFLRIPIHDYFEDCGWKVTAFSSGEEALEYLAHNSTDSVILDMRLPGMSGLEFINRANSLRKGIRYVIYTGSADFNITDDMRKNGISEECIVQKPADSLEQLVRAVERQWRNGG